MKTAVIKWLDFWFYPVKVIASVVIGWMCVSLRKHWPHSPQNGIWLRGRGKPRELKCKWAEDYGWKEHLPHIPNLNCCCCFSFQRFTCKHTLSGTHSSRWRLLAACNFILSFTFIADKNVKPQHCYHPQETMECVRSLTLGFHWNPMRIKFKALLIFRMNWNERLRLE